MEGAAMQTDSNEGQTSDRLDSGTMTPDQHQQVGEKSSSPPPPRPQLPPLPPQRDTTQYRTIKTIGRNEYYKVLRIGTIGMWDK